MRHGLIISVVACSLVAVGAVNVDIPSSVLFESDLGPVTFTHEQHIRWLGSDCSVCHHEGSGHHQACRQCHRKKRGWTEGDPLPFYDVKMQFCRGCHVREKEKDSRSKAAVACSDCHDIRKAARHAGIQPERQIQAFPVSRSFFILHNPQKGGMPHITECSSVSNHAFTKGGRNEF